MDIYFLIVVVLVVVLAVSWYCIFSSSEHLTASEFPERKATVEPEPKVSLKKKRRQISTKSDLYVSTRSEQSLNYEIGSDEMSDTEDDSSNDAANQSGNETVSEEMFEPAIDMQEDEYNIYRSILDKEKLKECIWKHGKFGGLCKYVSGHRVEWKNKQVKIAITGNSGTGKSSLINAMRGMRPDDIGAAKVGVTETTTKPVTYTFPNNDKLLIVDLPGMGTINFPKENYMRDMEVSTYDAFIIVAAGRITENDVWFVKEAMKNNKHVLFVRTKIDFDLSNAEHDHPKDFVKDKCLAEIRNEISNTLCKGLPSGKMCGIYLVTSREKDRYDFPKLVETLKKIVNVFGRAMRIILKEHIQPCMTQRRKQFGLQNFGRNLKAMCCDLIPAHMFDLPSALIETRQKCLFSFYLDDQSLELVSRGIGESVNDIKKKLKSFEEDEVKKSTTENFVFKPFWNIPHYSISTIGRVKHMCNVMAEDEMKLIDMKLDIIEEELSLL